MTLPATPSDDVFSLLLALEVGERLSVSPDGFLTITLPNTAAPAGIVSLADSLTELEARAWAAVSADGESVVVTPLGRAALGGWLEKRFGKKGRLVRGKGKVVGGGVEKRKARMVGGRVVWDANTNRRAA